MNSHVKITHCQPADLSRRSFLVGTAAAGLALGYSAVPGCCGADQAFAAAPSFDPSVWYSIAPDGIVTVTCGKADMGQHIASTMAQIISEELGSNWRDMRVQLASNDPKFNDPVLGAQITGGSWSTMMNFDAMSRAGAAGRIALTRSGRGLDGRAGGRARRPRLRVISHPKSKKSMTLCRHRQERQGDQDLHAGRAQGDQAEDARSVHHDRRLGAAARHPLEDQRHGQIRHRRHAAGHGVRQGGHAAGALRRHGEIGRRQRGEEGAGLHQGRHPRRQDRDDDRLGGGGRQHLCQRPQGGGCAEDHL